MAFEKMYQGITEGVEAVAEGYKRGEYYKYLERKAIELKLEKKAEAEEKRQYEKQIAAFKYIRDTFENAGKNKWSGEQFQDIVATHLLSLGYTSDEIAQNFPIDKLIPIINEWAGRPGEMTAYQKEQSIMERERVGMEQERLGLAKEAARVAGKPTTAQLLDDAQQTINSIIWDEEDELNRRMTKEEAEERYPYESWLIENRAYIETLTPEEIEVKYRSEPKSAWGLPPFKSVETFQEKLERIKGEKRPEKNPLGL